MVIQHLHISNVYKKDESSGAEVIGRGCFWVYCRGLWASSGDPSPHAGHQESEQERTVGLDISVVDVRGISWKGGYLLGYYDAR